VFSVVYSAALSQNCYEIWSGRYLLKDFYGTKKGNDYCVIFSSVCNT